VLTFIVTLAFCAGTLLRNALLAAAVLIFAWFPVNAVLHTFSLEEFSPFSLSQALRVELRRPWNADDPAAQPGTSPEDLAQRMRDVNKFLSVLSGTATPAEEPKGSFFEQGSYDDFSVLRVLLGYGLPTLAAFGLAIVSFCWRDL
jgi:hypothetical protein